MEWIHLNGLIAPSKALEMAKHMDKVYDPHLNLPDTQSRLSPAFYNIFCKIHLELTPIVARAFGVDLKPTYNYGRKYMPGDDLPIHRDRDQCEFSITVNLSRQGPIWPFYISLEEDGEPIQINLDIGDAVAYKGLNVYHWREELEEGIVHQMFFHWISITGRYKDQAYNKDEIKFKGRASREKISLY
jgi:hypothetical protein